MGLENREFSKLDPKDCFDIDFTQARKNLEVEREISRQFLTNALKDKGAIQ